MSGHQESRKSCARTLPDYLKERGTAMKKWVAIIVFVTATGGGVTYYLAQNDAEYDVYDYTEVAIFGGEPKSVTAGQVKTLDNIGYVVGYSESRKNPLWAAYRCFGIEDSVTHSRPSRFKVDKRTEAKISHDDYTDSNYSRGHMAPNLAIDICYGKEAQLETFVMSNVCPQKGSLNGGRWKSLERKIAKKWANELETVWVICGPIFGEDTQPIAAGWISQVDFS